MATLFNKLAPEIMGDLIRAFALKDFQAAGAVGNLGHESGGFLQMQEVHPVAGRGGLNIAQWTGPRRVAFEAFCKTHGLDANSVGAGRTYLVAELQSTESGTIPALKRTTTLQQATEVFEQHFERAGVKNYPSRTKWAALALAAYTTARKPAAPATTVAAPGAAPTSTGLFGWLRSLLTRKAA